MKGAARNLPTLFYAPSRFFAARAEDRDGNGEATLFALGISSVGASFDWLWIHLGWNLQPTAAMLRDSWPKYIAFHLLLSVVIVPLQAAVLHFVLYGLSIARESFAATYRICCYTAAGAVFSLIPYIGQVTGMIASMALLVIAVRETHRTSTKAAILATTLGWIRLFAVVLFATLGTTVFFFRH